MFFITCIFSALPRASKAELMHEGTEFKFRESKSMETVVGDLKRETPVGVGLKFSMEVKKLITSIGTSTMESNNYRKNSKTIRGFLFFSPKNCGLHSSADYIRVRISFFFFSD